MRVGMFLGRFFISTTTAILATTPVWWTLLCGAGAAYLMIFHTSSVEHLFLAGYLLLLAVAAIPTLAFTALVGIVLFGMWLSV